VSKEVPRMHTGSASSGLPITGDNASINCLLTSINVTASKTYKMGTKTLY